MTNINLTRASLDIADTIKRSTSAANMTNAPLMADRIRKVTEFFLDDPEVTTEEIDRVVNDVHMLLFPSFNDYLGR